jgi:hypothetical protein
MVAQGSRCRDLLLISGDKDSMYEKAAESLKTVFWSGLAERPGPAAYSEIELLNFDIDISSIS